MDKTIIKFGDNEIDKHKFHQYERPISIRNLDFNQIVVCKKVSVGKRVSNISSATNLGIS